MRALNVCRPLTEWRDPRHRRGIAGEVAAARHLEALGFRIEAHRFRLGHHDIDLVARRGRLVVFAEVKARATGTFGPGWAAVGWRKRRDIARVAELWIARHGGAGEEYRFDVLSVTWRRDGFPEVDHIEGAFIHVEKW
jgi:putative endonuclease